MDCKPDRVLDDTKIAATATVLDRIAVDTPSHLSHLCSRFSLATSVASSVLIYSIASKTCY